MTGKELMGAAPESSPDLEAVGSVRVLKQPLVVIDGAQKAIILATTDTETAPDVPYAFVTTSPHAERLLPDFPEGILAYLDGSTDITTVIGDSVHKRNIARHHADPFGIRARWAGHKAVKHLRNNLDEAIIAKNSK